MEQLNMRRPVKRVDISINMEATGANIRSLIKASGYSVRDIMAITGISTEQAVYKWFRGESIPAIETMLILCNTLSVEINEFLVIDGEFHFFERSSVNYRLNDCLPLRTYNCTVRNGENNMAEYKYEEHRCPYCEHQFIVEMRGTRYELRGSNEEHILTNCPKSGCGLYIASRWKYGCLSEFIPEEDVMITGLTV